MKRILTNQIKPMKKGDIITIHYNKDHWDRFTHYRSRALYLLSILKKQSIEGYIHGSIARGDINENSDIDIIIKDVIPSHKIELAFQDLDHTLFTRTITQATPSHTLKGHIYLDPFEKEVVTFPLSTLKTLEDEFYKFGGIVDYKKIINNIRIPGCTKRLTLIMPSHTGHNELSVIGREAEVSKTLDIKQEIIMERCRVLLRRDKIGRTGIFINRTLNEEESFEGIVKELKETNPAVRRFYAKTSKL